MAKSYRARVQSYGFRGKFWDVGEIADDVTDAENLPLPHFTEIVIGDAPANREPEEKEPNTLSELQDHQPSIKGRKKVFGK